MYRSTRPFRWAATRSAHAARATRDRAEFSIDLATWRARLSPANRPIPTPAAPDTAAPMSAISELPVVQADRDREAA